MSPHEERLIEIGVPESLVGPIHMVIIERIEQDQMWGKEHDREHTPEEWDWIINRYRDKVLRTGHNRKLRRRQALKLAAVALAIAEADGYEVSSTDGG